MKRLLLATLLSLAAAGASAATYTIDPNHTQVQFTYDHQGYAHLSGRFTEVSGALQYDEANPGASSIEVTLPISSLSTGFPKLDTHMQSADMFDAAQFPTASFKSTKVTVVAPKRLKVLGDLTIHGVTKPAEFEVRINSTAPHPRRKTAKVGMDARGIIKRSDFGVSFQLPAVPDEIMLSISMEANEPQPEPAPAPAADPAAAPAAAPAAEPVPAAPPAGSNG
jgi:polyisoprenoid-binding protein YceI